MRRRAESRALPVVPVVLVVLAVLPLGGCGGDDAPVVKSQPVARSGEVDAQIDVGGRSLHVVCQGEAAPTGVPTVILEAGLGGTTDSWFNVLSLLPSDVRACAYDRAGLGLSDPAPESPRSSADQAADLATMLQAAEIDPPYLLVAHSLGPWVSILYAADHAEDVAGMVLVDPRAPSISDDWLAGARAAAEQDPGAEEIVAGLRAFVSSPDANDEGLDIGGSQAEVSDALAGDTPLLGEAPIVVLAGARTPDEFPEVVRAPWTSSWRAGLRSFLSASTAARLVEVESGHMIPDDAPEAVVETIDALTAR